VCWLGRVASTKELWRLTVAGLSGNATASDCAERKMHRARLLASLFWRFDRAQTDSPAGSNVVIS
jgi:hypothetical protein